MKLISTVPIFRPTSNFRMVWNLLLLFVIVIEMFIISIELFVNGKMKFDNSNNGLNHLEWFNVTVLSINILLNFNTGFYQSGEIILSRREISRQYLKKIFVLDLVSLLSILAPLVWETVQNPGLSTSDDPGLFINWTYWIRALFFFKFGDLKKIYINFEEFLFNEEKYQNLLSLLGLFLELIGVTHFLACFWIFISSLSTSNSENSWLSRVEGLDFHSPWYEKYTFSLYWSFSTLFTVGYGDISAKNKIEIYFSMGAILFGCLFFAYAINSIGMLIDENNKKKKTLRSELRTINGLLRRNSVNLDLRIKVRKYLEHQFYEEGAREAEKEEGILNKLSNSLKEQVLIQINGRVLSSFPFFLKNFSVETLEKASQVMRTLRFAPGDHIFHEEDENNGSIYFVVEGEVELYVNCERSSGDYVKLKTVKQMEYFGLSTFFTGESRKYNARSQTFSTLFHLNRSDFLHILSKSEAVDWESFHMIKDNLLLYNQKLHEVNENCEACQEDGHTLFSCPFMRFKPDTELVINRHLYSRNQERKRYKRRSEKTRSAFLTYEHSKQGSPADFNQFSTYMIPYLNSDYNESINNSEIELLNEEQHELRRDLSSESPRFKIHLLSAAEGMTSLGSPQQTAPALDLNNNEIPLQPSLIKKGSLSPRKFKKGSDDKLEDEKERGSHRVAEATGKPRHHQHEAEQPTEPQLQLLFITDIDRLYNFKTYFPHNNSSVVVRYFQKRFVKKRKMKRKIKNLPKLQTTGGNIFGLKIGALIDHDEQKKFFFKEQKELASTTPLLNYRSPRKKRRTLK